MSASSGLRRQLLALPDGRDLDVVVGGVHGLRPRLLMILGRPSATIPYDPAVDIASERGMGCISSPGPGMPAPRAAPAARSPMWRRTSRTWLTPLGSGGSS